MDELTDDEGRSVHVKQLVGLKHWARPISKALNLEDGRLTFHVLEAPDPATAIVEFARRNQIDHIVMGARGNSALRRYLGSVSSQVVAESDCSVTVVRAAEAPPPASGRGGGAWSLGEDQLSGPRTTHAVDLVAVQDQRFLAAGQQRFRLVLRRRFLVDRRRWVLLASGLAAAGRAVAFVGLPGGGVWGSYQQGRFPLRCGASPRSRGEARAPRHLAAARVRREC
jgi:hypothetical protein